MIVADNIIEFRGSYGEEIPRNEVKSVELVDHLPKITIRTNGFSLGIIRKGYFKTKDGEIVKLILNSDTKPYILITKKNGKKIYFSSKEKSNKSLYNEIREKLPNIVLK